MYKEQEEGHVWGLVQQIKIGEGGNGYWGRQMKFRDKFESVYMIYIGL